MQLATLRFDLTIPRHSDFEQEFVLLDINGQPINLAGASFNAHAKKDYIGVYDPAVFLVTITGTLEGKIKLSLSRAQVDDILFNIGVYDVVMTDSLNKDWPVIRGNILMAPTVTRRV